MGSKIKQKKRREKQEGLLQEFSGQDFDHYEEKQVGDNWYVKSWNGGTGLWQVSIYKPESYRRYKNYQQDIHTLNEYHNFT